MLMDFRQKSTRWKGSPTIARADGRKERLDKKSILYPRDIITTDKDSVLAFEFLIGGGWE
jgi:hypothetical protein